MYGKKGNLVIGHGKGGAQWEGAEVDKEAEERNVKVEEKMAVFIVKLRVSTQDYVINHGCVAIWRYSTSSSH